MPWYHGRYIVLAWLLVYDDDNDDDHHDHAEMSRQALFLVA